MSRIFSTIIRKAPKLINATTNTNKPSFIRNISTSYGLFAPMVQQKAPDFKGTAVVGSDFKEIQLSDFKGKYLILFFYPLDFTFVCPTELVAFDKEYSKFQKLNTELVGVSVDSHYTHLGWINTPRSEGGLGNISYPLLSDLKKDIARDYEVLLEKEGIALRGLFLIDPKGIVRHMCVNDLPIGRSVDEALRLVEAVQFADTHGEVCPANWRKGDKTIKPDPKGSKEFFKTQK
ncbi:peroxiredoxin-2 [Agrilus planipennis]|uniref:thioredoxin-dependent peroxiredoxin n=1 Tax=Agrilus planipennis TaxID=224129 RepID=A0A1W4X1D9_AGRPL|nr:peroxiredoxin-2 [Agrilus planipennis]